jgi:NAD(P)-dependent dehydrogenase (short-subunit alcohol dehydrogenase family)
MEFRPGDTAFVTGAAGGIGRGIAEALIAQGMRVALADRDVAELETTVAELAESGADVLAVPLDVTDREAWAEAATAVHSAFGTVRVLVNNAGVSTLGMRFEEVEPRVWDSVVAINLTGVYNGLHAFYDDVLLTKGYIVNTASVGGLMGAPALSPYSTTKAAVIALTESLRAELRDHGVGVSVLCPGGVRSRLWRTSRSVRGLPDVDVPPEDGSAQSATAAMLPREVGDRVVDAMRHDILYIMTHPEMRMVSDYRVTELEAGWEFAASFGSR